MAEKILVVDDDRELVELISFALLRAGLEPVPAFSDTQALHLLVAEQPALVLLDVRRNDENVYELLEAMRLVTGTPIVITSDDQSEDAAVRAFELGADDFVVKPFGARELLARLQARLRRGSATAEVDPMQPLEIGSLTLDPLRHTVSRDGRRIDLTPTEFRLLHYLMRHANRVVTSRSLMQQLWYDDRPSSTSPLRMTMHRLRRKLGSTAEPSEVLEAIAGVGFILKECRAQSLTG